VNTWMVTGACRFGKGMWPIARPFYARLQEGPLEFRSSLLAAQRVQAAKSLLLHSNKSLLRLHWKQDSLISQPSIEASARSLELRPDGGEEPNAPSAEGDSTSPLRHFRKRSKGRHSGVSGIFHKAPAQQKAKLRHFQSRQGLETSKIMGRSVTNYVCAQTTHEFLPDR
jgi:hypothetical protein